jgi:hypothetical protein
MAFFQFRFGGVIFGHFYGVTSLVMEWNMEKFDAFC